MTLPKATGLFVLLLLLVPLRAAEASGGALFISPAYETPAVGEKFDIRVYVDTGGVGASAAEAGLSFDPSALSIDHISTAGSLVGSWPTPPSFSNTTGTMEFTGWMSQYYAGSNGLLLTVTFTALRTTMTDIRLVSGTILGAGTDNSNIITSMRSASVSIQPQEIIPSAPPLPAPASVPPVTSSPPPSAPTLTAAESIIPAGTDLIATGTAEPHATIFVWLQQGEELPASSTLATGSDGSFAYVSDTPVPQGVYTLWAQAQGSDGQKSALSQKITITAQAEDVTAAAAIMAGSVASGLSPYLALLLVVVIGAGYFYRRR